MSIGNAPDGVGAVLDASATGMLRAGAPNREPHQILVRMRSHSSTHLPLTRILVSRVLRSCLMSGGRILMVGDASAAMPLSLNTPEYCAQAAFIMAISSSPLNSGCGARAPFGRQ